MWGVHAGGTPNVDQIFLDRSQIALGWPRVDSLEAAEPTRDAYKLLVSQAFPEKSEGATRSIGGQLFRFAIEARIDDWVVYARKHSRVLHIGRIIGPYHYDGLRQPLYPHARPVRWNRSIPRSSLSEGAQFELRSAMSFFRIRTYSEEILRALATEANVSAA